VFPGDCSVSQARMTGSAEGAVGPANPSGRTSAVLKLTSVLDLEVVCVLMGLEPSNDPDARSGASSERMQEASRRFPIPACPTSCRSTKSSKHRHQSVRIHR